jgi:formiminotetrahydrofolate cyclodeaminase
MTALHEETRLEAMSLARFAEELAAAAPTPGGSSAAAVPAALAAGLVAMIARLSAAGDPFGDLAFDLDDVAREADELRAELLALVGEDAAAFERVIAARRDARPEEIQRAYEDAVLPPLRACARSLRVLELAVDVTERGNPHAAADAGVAVAFATASIEAAALTAELYLLPIESEAFRSAREDELQAVRAGAVALHAA